MTFNPVVGGPGVINLPDEQVCVCFDCELTEGIPGLTAELTAHLAQL